MANSSDLASAPRDAIHRELVARAKALAPLLAEQAAEAERIRKPTDEVIRAIADAEIFKLMVPRCYGGFELDMDAFFDVVVARAEGDASMSWVAAFYIEHNWILCLFPEAFQRELYAERSYVLAPGMVSPSGRATKDSNAGFRLSGRWQWATGVMHSDWVIAGALIEPTEGTPDFRWFALPQEEIRIEDSWYVDGMVGTGSNDVVIQDAHVPAERTVSMVDMTNGRAPGSRLHTGPLYRTPMVPLLATAAALPALGQARNSRSKPAHPRPGSEPAIGPGREASPNEQDQ